MCSVASLAESIAFAVITPDRNGPKALVFMQAVAGDTHPKCSREHFREICHCLVHAAPFYTEYLAQLVQTLGKNESLAPLRDILREELSAQMPTLRERMYETTRGFMEKYPFSRLHQEDGWIAYLKDCFQYPKLGQLVGEVALDVFAFPESPEHDLDKLVGEMALGVSESPESSDLLESREHSLRSMRFAEEQRAWRERVFACALSAMRAAPAACLPEKESSLGERTPVFAPV